jgi:hypothetical protein
MDETGPDGQPCFTTNVMYGTVPYMSPGAVHRCKDGAAVGLSVQYVPTTHMPQTGRRGSLVFFLRSVPTFYDSRSVAPLPLLPLPLPPLTSHVGRLHNAFDVFVFLLAL